ncbi:MAG TPA: hypothetical protein PKL17_03165 [Pseudomonadota bacterium]|nr:hypothetical protein [Pseudomonadota bacterium]HNK43754.1 hypothetical protein [Pseudomonadota bacterium]
MRSVVVALFVGMLGLWGCERQTGLGSGPRHPDGSAGQGAVGFADLGGAAPDLRSVAVDLAAVASGSRTDLGVAAPDAGAAVTSGGVARLADHSDSATDTPAPVLKQSAVSADLLVLELGEGDAVKKLSAIASAQAEVRCEEVSDHEAGSAHTRCDSRLVIKSAPDSDSVLATFADDVPGVLCKGEETASCFESADVAISWLALPGLPGGLVMVSGSTADDHVWERENATPVAVYGLVRRGTLEPLELRELLRFSSLTHRENIREDHPEMTRRERERDPMRTDEDERSDLSVMGKSKRRLPDLLATVTAETVRKFVSKPDKRQIEKHKIRYVFDGIRYVPDDISLQTAAHCGSLTTHCGPLQDCCGGKCKTLSTVEHCGSCGRVCPGGLLLWSDAACIDPAKGVCFFGCQGSHYDVDGKETNGCELHDTTPDLTDLGTQSCYDKPLLWQGMLLSDSREHRSPALSDRDAKTGAVAKRGQVRGSGGLFCQNDLALTVTLRDGPKEPCYQLAVEGLKQPLTIALSGIDDRNLVLPRGAYVSGSSLRFRLTKTCFAPAAVKFAVAFHL